MQIFTSVFGTSCCTDPTHSDVPRQTLGGAVAPALCPLDQASAILNVTCFCGMLIDLFWVKK